MEHCKWLMKERLCTLHGNPEPKMQVACHDREIHCGSLSGKNGCLKNAHCKWLPKTGLCAFREHSELPSSDSGSTKSTSLTPSPSSSLAGCVGLDEDACGSSSGCTWSEVAAELV